MTKEINRTIRSLKRSLRELNNVSIESFLFSHKDDGYYDPDYSDDRLNMSKYYIKTLINYFEEEYRELHKAGAYNE